MVIKYDGPVFAHMLQTIKGWSLLTALDKTAPIASVSATRASNWVAGRVGYITDTGTIDLLAAGVLTATYRPMPLYLWQGATDLDVLASGAVGSSTYWQNAVPAGFITGLVATGGYELQTTEFNTGGTYTPNTPLSVMADSGDYSAAGKLTPTAFNTGNYVCGIASLHCQWLYNAPHNIDRPTRATGTNANGVNTLTFWTYYLPRCG